MGYTYVGSNRKIKAYLGSDLGFVEVDRMYYGNIRVYPNAGNVTYVVDNGISYIEEVDIDDSCLSPTTFTPSKSGWTFIGWREDTAANSSVLSSKIMDGNDVTLYAVFRQTITLSYNGNGATGGSTASQSNYRYYNNENITNPSFIIRSNGFSRTYYSFVNWAMGSTSGTRYNPGASVTLSANTTFYAVWNSLVTSTTKSGSFTAKIENWRGGNKLIPFGCIFTSNPSVTLSESPGSSHWVDGVESNGLAAMVVTWGSSSMSGGEKTESWTATGTAYKSNSDAPIKYASGSFEAKIENWSGGSRQISFGTTFSSIPTVQVARGIGSLSVTVSNITTTGCTISWGSSSASGGTWIIEWGATGNK